MKRITENSSAAEIWAHYQDEKRRFLEPIARNFAITVSEAREARAEADHAGYALKAAEARIRELEREVEKLVHYQEIVEQALAEAE